MAFLFSDVACVAAFEGAGNDIKQQLGRLPATPKRKEEIAGLNWLGIDILRGVSPGDQDFINVMFNRRHVLSHSAGRVDQKYLDRTGDRSVGLSQRI